MSSARKIGGVVASVVLWIVILLAAMFAFVTLATKDDTNIANIGGVSPLSIQSDSMVPTFQKGDMIFIKQTDPETLEIGDIVTFHTIIQNEYVLNTHRIVEIKDVNGVKNYVTQGDNNAVKDEHVIVGGDIVGKYMTKVPKLGAVMDAIGSKIGFFIIIVLPMLAFFIYQVYHLIMVSSELKKATAIEAALAAQQAVEAAGGAPANPPAAAAEVQVQTPGVPGTPQTPQAPPVVETSAAPVAPVAEAVQPASSAPAAVPAPAPAQPAPAAAPAAPKTDVNQMSEAEKVALVLQKAEKMKAQAEKILAIAPEGENAAKAKAALQKAEATIAKAKAIQAKLNK